MAKQTQTTHLKLDASQRLATMGRLRMAEWIAMREPDFAREIEQLEKDPLFKKLFFGAPGNPGAIRRQRWPHGALSGSFYEVDENRAAGGERVQVEQKLDERSAVVTLVQRIGRPAFEKYFLNGDEPLSLEEIAERTKLSMEEVRSIHDLLLELGAQEEFAVAEATPSAPPAACLARVTLENGEPSFEFFSAYWARGLYQVRYDRIEEWKTARLLAGPDLRKLRPLLKKIETLNLRQNTLYRILERLVEVQSDYIATKKEERKAPVSLRLLARSLGLAPSTVSRAASHRLLELPWGDRAPLIELMPGRRQVVRAILARWKSEGPLGSDSALAERLARENGIQVARRTVNEARRQVEQGGIVARKKSGRKPK